MNFRREKFKNPYLGDTQVENIFLMEYMAAADGDFVKVYLTALMYADDEYMSNSLIARHLGMNEEDVLRAWNYWEDCGVIRKRYRDPQDRFHYTVEFINLKEKLFAPQKKAESGTGTMGEESASEGSSSLMDDKVLRETFESIEHITNRMLESREASAIVSWIHEDGVDPDLICFVYKFCAEHRESSRFQYVANVLRHWMEENVRTVEDAEKFLQETDLRHNQYRRVMKALGFHRNPTEKEEMIIDSWFDELGFDIGKILEACAKTSGISNPNINYVNSILLSWSGKKAKSASGAGGTAKEGNPAAKVKRLYEELRKRKEAELEERRRDVYAKVPRIREIDMLLKKTNLELSRLALSSGANASEERRRLTSQLNDLSAEKAFLLTEQNLPCDYLEIQYECKYCKDTGVLDSGQRCSCYSEKLKRYI